MLELFESLPLSSFQDSTRGKCGGEGHMPIPCFAREFPDRVFFSRGLGFFGGNLTLFSIKRLIGN
jgi:hypothetical protein